VVAGPGSGGAFAGALSGSTAALVSDEPVVSARSDQPSEPCIAPVAGGAPADEELDGWAGAAGEVAPVEAGDDQDPIVPVEAGGDDDPTAE
jgi:hypothetical protein